MFVAGRIETTRLQSNSCYKIIYVHVGLDMSRKNHAGLLDQRGSLKIEYNPRPEIRIGGFIAKTFVDFIYCSYYQCVVNGMRIQYQRAGKCC